MDTLNLIESFADFARQKNIDRPTMIRILEDVFKTMIRKKYETDDNFDIIINADKGDLEIWRRREIVENGEVEDPLEQISITDALKIEPDYEVGEEAYEEIITDKKQKEINRKIHELLFSDFKSTKLKLNF